MFHLSNFTFTRLDFPSNFFHQEAKIKEQTFSNYFQILFQLKRKNLTKTQQPKFGRPAQNFSLNPWQSRLVLGLFSHRISLFFNASSELTQFGDFAFVAF